jgi:hypothetical protein
MRTYKTFQDRMRWDLWGWPNPIYVCSTCNFFQKGECNLPNQSNPRGYLFDPNLYLCNEIQIAKYLEPFLKENPYKDFNLDQIKTLRESIAKVIDLSIVFRDTRNSVGGGKEVDDVDLAQTYYNKSKLWIYGSVRTIELNGYSYSVHALSIPLTKIESITVFKNGAWKKFSLTEFCDHLDTKTLYPIMEKLDNEEMQRLENPHLMVLNNVIFK